jgi:uncharacterized phage-like protein YoqJ
LDTRLIALPLHNLLKLDKAAEVIKVMRSYSEMLQLNRLIKFLQRDLLGSERPKMSAKVKFRAIKFHQLILETMVETPEQLVSLQLQVECQIHSEEMLLLSCTTLQTCSKHHMPT